MKTFIKKLGMLLSVLLGSLSAYAYDFEVDGIFFNIVSMEDLTCEVTDGDWKYEGNVIIPAEVEYNNNKLSVVSIGYRAFFDCHSLTSVEIPNSVTTIEDFAFSYCSSLASVVIPNSVISIGNGAFKDCDNILSVTIGSGMTSIKSEVFSHKIPKVIWLGNTPPAGASNVDAYQNYVSNNEFNLYNQTVYPFLSSRFEVDNVMYVPVSPSERTCDVIDCNYNPTHTEIEIDSVVKNKNVELKVLNVNSYAFYNNSQITKLSISNNGYIGSKAFYHCDALTSVEASNNGDIGFQAFYNCGALTSVKASNNGDIGSEAFIRCVNLKTISLGSKIISIGAYAFYGNKSLESIIIPDNISYVGESVFSGCSSLKNVSLGRGLNKLSKHLFKECSSLSTIIIPENIVAIEDYAFSGCTELGDVTFEEVNNSNKEPQYFPEWTSTNPDHNSTSSNVYSILVEPGDVLSFEIWSNSEINSDVLRVYVDGSLITNISGVDKAETITKTFDYSGEVSLRVEYSKDGSGSSSNDEAGIRDIILWDKAMTITLGSNDSSPLFSSCKLDEVYIGRKLSYGTSSSYGYSPFYRNLSLRKVTITDSETQIYDNEFYGCSNLQEFSCGDGVTEIGNWAFSGCSAMESYLSGTNVESIGKEAFSDCTALTSFTSNAPVPPVCGKQALDDINKWECTLYVPSESVDDYQAAEQWKEFFFIEESGVDAIADDESVLTSPTEYYNLSGAKVDDSKESLTPGIYIKRQGTKSEKMMIK